MVSPMTVEPRDTDPKRLVRDSYDRISRAYRGDSLPRDRGYFRWLDLLVPCLKKGDSVLDLGCGCGIPVAQELATFCNVMGVDISPVQVERARALVPAAKFQCQDMTTVNFEVGSFAAIVSLFAIIHVPLAEQRPLFDRISSWLQPCGYFLGSVGNRAWTGYKEDWYGAPMYWSHADEDTYLTWLGEVGLKVTWRQFVPEGHAGHTLFLAQRSTGPGRSSHHLGEA
jgi:SAM-dependent methyltransferase